MKDRRMLVCPECLSSKVRVESVGFMVNEVNKNKPIKELLSNNTPTDSIERRKLRLKELEEKRHDLTTSSNYELYCTGCEDHIECFAEIEIIKEKVSRIEFLNEQQTIKEIK